MASGDPETWFGVWSFRVEQESIHTICICETIDLFYGFFYSPNAARKKQWWVGTSLQVALMVFWSIRQVFYRWLKNCQGKMLVNRHFCASQKQFEHIDPGLSGRILVSINSTQGFRRAQSRGFDTPSRKLTALNRRMLLIQKIIMLFVQDPLDLHS